MNYPKSEVAEAREKLLALCPPGTTIYTNLKHVSRSGMQREISCYVIEDGRPRWITWYVARVLGYRIGKRDGVIVGGCGMDMGYHVVNSLSYVLHGMENKGLPRIDSNSSESDRTLERRAHNKPTPDLYVAGYSLCQEWL